MSKELQSQLAATQKELEALRAEFKEYTYVISHDLAAPFRQIYGFSEIILSNIGDDLDEKTKHHFDLICKGSKNGSEMIESLLSYSRLCTKPLDITSVNSSEVAEAILEQLAPIVQETDADITFSNLPIVEADFKQLDALLHELLQNALQYRRPDVRPVIQLEGVDDKDDWIFCLTDNGTGISENQISKVFTVLRRGVVDKNPEQKGMGLAIAKRIVQNHGGSIWVESDGLSGSAVYFSFPKRIAKT